MGNDVLWVVCGNDYPAGRAYRTEQEADDYCLLMNEQQKEKEKQSRFGVSHGRVYYHCHRVEVM